MNKRNNGVKERKGTDRDKSLILRALIKTIKVTAFKQEPDIVAHQKVKLVDAQPDHHNAISKYGREKIVQPIEAKPGFIPLKDFFDTAKANPLNSPLKSPNTNHIYFHLLNFQRQYPAVLISIISIIKTLSSKKAVGLL